MNRGMRILAVVVMACGGVASAELLPTERDASPERLKALAENYEKQGQPLEAAAAYERLIEIDPLKKTVLAHRLVQICAEAHMEPEALKWADVVTERNPEPAAYLAGVHSMLGNPEKAIALLEGAIAQAGMSRRKLSLYWQLAEVHEKWGDPASAERALLDATEAAKGTRDEGSAWRRLCRFYKDQGTLADHMTAWEARLAANPEDTSMRRVLSIAQQMAR